ncbi:hypothetical protein ELH80_01180 [Rhizobium ruizarguesonis]|uniref:hypothetical protein n=1 Tax=Rhizobium ruizarguesonis TaxID=2081791 RepID=UPI001031DBD8|nr:hypothetical protein [Rhizobium ruizarguesonis]TAZ33171.1 hypothetical protein ELH80_01180 [Rhizobium ruizarguesonis]TBC07829.1 hypothetical protein ELH37_01200 [Rhizobium ruizarguesonis]
MLHLIEEADKKGDALAKVAIKFLEKAHQNKGKIVSRLPEKRQETIRTLSKVWLDYQTDRSLEPVTMYNRIENARVARDKLNTALELLTQVPKTFVAEFERFKTGPSLGEFAHAVEVVARAKQYALRLNQDHQSGRPSDEVVTRTAHRLARLYSSLCDRPFPRSYVYLASEKKEFASAGPEFVRLILTEIDSTVEPREVATALKKFKSTEK